MTFELTKKQFVEMCEYISTKADEDSHKIGASFYSEEEKKEARKNLELARVLLSALLED